MIIVLPLLATLNASYVHASVCAESKESMLPEIFAALEASSEKPLITVETGVIEDEAFTQDLSLRIQTFAKKYPSRFLEKLKFNILITNWSNNELGALKRGRLQLNEIKLREFEKKNPRYTERVVHHELSHLIFIQFAESSRKRAMVEAYDQWRAQHQSTVGAYQDKDVPLEELREGGFLEPYALTNFHEDFAVYAEALFTGQFRNGDSFWSAHDRSPAIQKKTALVVSVYQEADPEFSLEYFRGLRQ
jgi:hypothetical protein